jgi:D-arabinitol dehydrogenase (NADP+)
VKAAFYDAPYKVSVRETAIPQPGPQDVLVRVAACGICGTDQHILQGDFFPTYPLIGGHELAGEVVAVGDAVDNFRPGDRVAVDPGVYCGHCYFCQRAQGNHCLNWSAIGVTRDGGFAEYVLAPRANIYSIGDMPYEVAAFIEPVSCVVYGVRRLAPSAGTNALVYGAGPIGLLMTQLLRHTTGGTVTTVDLKSDKLALAGKLGANNTVQGGPDADQSLRGISPYGFDIVVDCTGVPQVVEHMFTHVRAEGKLLFFGVNPTEAHIKVSPYEVFKKDLQIFGSFALRYTFHQAIEAMSSGAVQVAPLISDRLPVDRFAEALSLAGSGSALKVQIHPR